MDTLTRRRAPDETRAEIIEKALEVAAELGAAGFTLDAVAARTRVSKGALLHHFPSKTALLEGMVDHLGAMHVESVLAEAARDPEPYGRNARAYLRVTINEPVTPQDVSIGGWSWPPSPSIPAWCCAGRLDGADQDRRSR